MKFGLRVTRALLLSSPPPGCAESADAKSVTNVSLKCRNSLPSRHQPRQPSWQRCKGRERNMLILIPSF